MIRLSNKYTIRRQTLLLNSLAPHSLPADPPAAASLCLSYLIPSDPPTRGRLRCRLVLGVVWSSTSSLAPSRDARPVAVLHRVAELHDLAARQASGSLPFVAPTDL
jgi:hypothetical protein